MALRGFCLPADTSVADRLMFHSVCDLTSRCQVWLGYRQQGYGRISIGGKLFFVHRLAFETFVGPIPVGLQIDHLCRNRACLNVDHLEAVNARANVRRGRSPGALALTRTHCSAGHEFAVHGVVRAGRRICHPCYLDYQRRYSAQRKAAWMARGLAA